MFLVPASLLIDFAWVVWATENYNYLQILMSRGTVLAKRESRVKPRL